MRNVGLCSLIRMMCCLKRMGMGCMGVMSRFFMMTGSVMGGCFLMMLRGLIVMLGGLGVMGVRWMMLLRCFFSHVFVSFYAGLVEHAVCRSVP